MKFVDRSNETNRLLQALNRKQTSLVVVYGRRRLGKSTLIKKVLSEDDIYFCADLSESHHQRYLISKIISVKFPYFDKADYQDWESIFRVLNNYANEKFTLCIDEFPYLVKQSPELPSIIQKLLDEKSLKYNIILCGSSQQMMYDICLDAHSPLYGRANEQIHLKPISLPFLKQALKVSSKEAIEEYAVWGGVPRYWELREERTSLFDALWHNVFSVNGLLIDEPSKLFKDDVNDIVKTSTLMSYICSGANKLSEIAARCGEPATNLSRPLKKLLDLGYIEKEIPYGVDKKNNKKSLYKVADPFIAFYYQFVVPNRSFIELSKSGPIQYMLDKHFSEYVSEQWEDLCRKFVSGNTINGITYGIASRWWGKIFPNKEGEMVEIDVVAESLDKKHVLLAECKWTNKANAGSLLSQLDYIKQFLPFIKEGQEIHTVLFLRDKLSDKVFSPDDICG